VADLAGVLRGAEAERPAIVEGLGAERLDAVGVARAEAASFAASPAQSAAWARASVTVCALGWFTFAPASAAAPT